MRPQRHTIVAIAGAAVLAAPSAAAAQGSVDEQYRDPFAGDGGGSQTTQPAPSEDTAPPSAGSPAPAEAEPAPTATTAGQLPRTGLPALPIAAAGLALAAAGAALRRRLP